MSTTAPRVSCVIRTLNEEEYVGLCIDTIRGQKGFDVEVVVVDSASKDATLSIVRQRDVHLIEIEPGGLRDFDYSRALNQGIAAASGDFIVILSAHTIPVDDLWLGRLMAHFEDSRVVGVYSRQIPWPDANWDEVLRIEKTFGPQPIVFGQGATLPLACFSNAASCIRRATWEQYPFTLPSSEDFEWATRMVANGSRIVYEAAAMAHHSHKESCRDVARRAINLARSGDRLESRRRNLWTTVCEAGSWFLIDLKNVLGLEVSPLKKVAYARQVLARSFWFVVEFRK